MKKNKGCLTIFISICIFTVWIMPDAYSKIIPVQSPGNGRDIQPNIIAALNSSASGDEILLPRGKFIFNGRFYLNKKVSITGEGIWNESTQKGTLLYRDPNLAESTLLNTNAVNMFYVDPGTDAKFDITFSDFTIRGKKPSITTNDGLSLAPDNGIYLRYVNGFRITRMRFEYFGESAIHVMHRDNIAHGLIDHNEFYYNVKDPNGQRGTRGLGLGYGVVVYGEEKMWVDDPRFGSDNFIFIEDNYFEFHRHSVAAGGGALYVARYNIVKNNLVASGIDAHESDPGGGNTYATRAVEIYNNTLINTLYRDFTPINPGDKKDVNLVPIEGIGIRGGEALVHHNTIKGYLYGGRIVDHYFKSMKSYPIPYQPGYESGLRMGPDHKGTDAVNGEGDLFYWSNTFTPLSFDNPSGSYSSVPFYNENPAPTGPFKEGRDYHLVTKPGYTPYAYPHPLQGRRIPCSADINQDGMVSSRDLSELLGKFGQTCNTTSSCPADINRDGIVSGSDLSNLLGEFGSLCLLPAHY